ncbi:MAG: hypothetical protein EXR72_07975 [Myxococcales bacterium]|nr:hypothetical protein [Myxococcales bacterium]
MALRSLGRLDEAEREADAAAEGLAMAGSLRAHALATLGGVRLERGDAAGALAVAREARGLLAFVGVVDEGEASVRLIRAEALRAMGEPEAAGAAIAEARDRLLSRAATIQGPRAARRLPCDSGERAHAGTRGVLAGLSVE